jgi:hypothetical protein
LEQLRVNQLFTKQSKYTFCGKKVEYFRHIISGNVVVIDPKKTAAIQEWPALHTIKEWREFLELAGYYRKFIKKFGIIRKPLIELLKKYSFGWNEMAQETFERLKGALRRAHVLALLDFRKVFVLETNACTNGL